MSAFEDAFRAGDRAELLGAIYGDGSIERRSKNGRKVGVAVSDAWPEWYGQVPRLYLSVFGRYMWSERGKRKTHTAEDLPPPGLSKRTRNFEVFVTTHDPTGIFGVSDKYSPEHWLRPPEWVSSDPEFLRRFVRGLVETDGCFHLDKADGTPEFALSQANDYLSAWFTETLCRIGYPCYTGWLNRAGVNQPKIGVASEVRRFGEWVKSEKWEAIASGGTWTPRPAVVNRKAGGVAVKARPATVLSTVPLDEQERWRLLRKRGASIGAIARHVGRANTVIASVVCDIIPEVARTAEDLDLVPQPHFPKKTPADAEPVVTWRSRAAAGESTLSIVRDFPGVSESAVNAAVCDIRWGQLKAKRERDATRLRLMMTSAQGHGRWADSG